MGSTTRRRPRRPAAPQPGPGGDDATDGAQAARQLEANMAGYRQLPTDRRMRYFAAARAQMPSVTDWDLIEAHAAFLASIDGVVRR